jgi:hypothetical protein
MSTEQVAKTSRRYTEAQKEQAIRLVRQIREETGERHGAVQRCSGSLVSSARLRGGNGP